MPIAAPASKPTIWFVGLTTLDVIHRVAVPAASNKKVTATRQDVAAGGPAATAAITAAALGANAVLLSAIGESPIAAAAKADLTAAGVKMLDAAQGEPFPLAVSAVEVTDGSGERSVVSADAALASAPKPSASELTELATVHGYPAVILLDGHHPELARGVVEWVANTVIPGKPEPRIVLDCGRWRPIFAELFSSAEVVACSADFKFPDDDDSGDNQDSEYDADAAVADDADEDNDPTGAILDELAQAVVITHGANPVTYETQEGLEGEVAVPAVPVMDTLGAGDAFHGALAVAIARRGIGQDGTPRDIDDILPQVIADAIAVAAERVQHIGPRTWLSAIASLKVGEESRAAGE